ncbi:dicarboxylate/amino acid:cation symporter, partial [bacterium]|nr:dicarboxylate/amino acid:cation symporter [bacterium]
MESYAKHLTLWIFVGLFLGILLPLIFPQMYQITETTLATLQNDVNQEQIAALKTLESQEPLSRDKFISRLKTTGDYSDHTLQELVLTNSLHKKGVLPIANFLAMFFLRLLKMIIVPLIITSITSGVISAGSSQGSLGRLGLKTFSYYIISSLLAILTGLILVNLLQPGVGAELGLQEQVTNFNSTQYTGTGAFLNDFIQRIIPTNPFQAISNGNILPVIFFCITFGVFVTKLEEVNYRENLTTFFQAAFEVMMKMTKVIILLAPLGVLGLIARIIATTGFEPFKSLGIYFITVLAGLSVHYFITLPLILTLFGISPLKHIRNMLPALLTAFSTSSSSATLPLTIQRVEKNAGVSNRISSFVLPLGATVNMDGTALYECVAAVFIAQAYGIELTFFQQFIVVFTSLLASIGAAGIPMAGLVMITIILKAIGLPLEGVG